MSSQPTRIRIPLVGISGKVEFEGHPKELPQGLKRISEVEVNIPQGLPGQYYAIEVTNIVRESVESGRALGIFWLGRNDAGLNDVYALGITGRVPLVCKVIKNDARSGSFHQGEPSQTTPSYKVKNRRKSFMTPTPLHIPESQVSPIPDSAHEMIYLKGLSGNEPLQVIPLRDVVWMHPLIAVMQNPEG